MKNWQCGLFELLTAALVVAVVILIIDTPSAKAISEAMVSPECRLYYDSNKDGSPVDVADIFISEMNAHVTAVEFAKGLAAETEAIAQAEIFRLGCVVFDGDVSFSNISRMLEYGWRLRLVRIETSASSGSFHEIVVPAILKKSLKIECIASSKTEEGFPKDAMELITGKGCLVSVIKRPDQEATSSSFGFTFVRETPYVVPPVKQ